jgi:VanZ family protein
LDLNIEGAGRFTTDMPAQKEPRMSIDLVHIATRYAIPFRIGYLLCIGAATLMNLGFEPSLDHVAERWHRALGLHFNFKDAVDAVRNVVLFCGWGATWMLTSRAPVRARDIGLATILGLLASMTVEGAQLFSPYRTASVLDVATNSLGALVGALAFWLLEHRTATDLRRGTTIGIPGWIPASALLTTALSLAFAPSSRASLIVGWGATPKERAAVVAQVAPSIVPWSALSIDAFAWLAVGLTVALAISDRTGKVRGQQLIWWLLILPVTLFLVHLGRAYAGLQREATSWHVQALALTIGLGIGLVAVPVWRGRTTARTTRALHIGLLAAGLGALMSWVPAFWVAGAGAARVLSWRQFIPMLSLLERQDMSSVFLVLQKAGIGAALGACLAARSRLGAPIPGLRSAILYAGILELGQFLVPGRYPDITDVLITSAAAGLVAILIKRADYAARIAGPVRGRP